MTPPPRVGVVIVTYNTRQHIGRCLTALAAQTRRAERVVLMDNDSSDGTLLEARAVAGAASASAIQWVEAGDNIGFAAANNRAVERLGDCDFIATLNPMRSRSLHGWPR